MFVCVLNSRTNIGYFYINLSVVDNNDFHAIFALHPTLNLLKNKHILLNLQKKFVVQTNFVNTDKFFLFFFCWLWDLILVLTDIFLTLQQLSKIFKNRSLCLEKTDKYLSLSAILLSIFAVHVCLSVCAGECYISIFILWTAPDLSPLSATYS